MQQTFNFLSGSLALENKPFHFQVADIAVDIYSECNGFIAYKLTTLGRASDEDVPSFIIITREHGIVLLDVIEEKVEEIYEKGGVEYWRLVTGEVVHSRTMIMDIYRDEVISRLKNDLSLFDRKSKKVRVPITALIVFCDNKDDFLEAAIGEYDEIKSVYVDNLKDILKQEIPDYSATVAELERIYSLMEGTFIFENKRAIDDEVSLITVNDYIQESLKTTFKQDDAQRLASMMLPPGPQRIRGLAGTGKTIVLCLKAAITHKRFKDFKILYLFNTQSLYNNVRSLISKYYTLEAKRAPDFEDRLQVLHAWGGRQRPGLYSELCKKYGIIPLTFPQVRGKKDSLAYIYEDLLNKIGDSIEPEYDLVLIDEAQDFSDELFKIIFKLTKGEGEKKRIIWAYDEFQSLRDNEMKEPSELFGKNPVTNEPNIPDSALVGNYPGGIPKDFVLPNCYRTPRPILMTAHGVAMGIYSSNSKVVFSNPNDWRAIGYKVVHPQAHVLREGEEVKIERPEENSRNLLEGLMRDNGKRPLNLVQCDEFATGVEQINFIAKKIHELVVTQRVSPEEIIVVNLLSGNNKESMLNVQKALMTEGIKSVIPGYVESADVFKLKDFVTITTPFRAKGNEGNIVFVINSQRVVDDFTLRMRNAFFVAVTRSRGWCYITGYGSSMSGLKAEVDSIKKDFPFFNFVFPAEGSQQRAKSFLNKSDKELDKIQEMFELMKNDPELRKLIMENMDEPKKSKD